MSFFIIESACLSLSQWPLSEPGEDDGSEEWSSQGSDWGHRSPLQAEQGGLGGSGTSWGALVPAGGPLVPAGGLWYQQVSWGPLVPAAGLWYQLGVLWYLQVGWGTLVPAGGPLLPAGVLPPSSVCIGYLSLQLLML